MSKEIGGYFELELSISEYLHSDCVPLNSGRNCLKYLIQKRDIRDIWIPDYICDAVELACRETKARLHKYKIGPNFLPESDPGVCKSGYLYLVDYYGQLSESDIFTYLNIANGNLIVDAAHSYFRDYRSDIDVLYTCRKFFGVPDGGFLKLKNQEYGPLEGIDVDKSYNRMLHLLGRFEEDASSFYDVYQENEKKIYYAPIKIMSRLTRGLLSCFNYEQIKNRREENFRYLEDLLSPYNLLTLRCPEGPYMYPLMLDSQYSETIRRQLIDSKIYVPILWPNVLQAVSCDSWAHQYAWSIIPLPIDQRYGKEDMRKIADLIRFEIDA